MSNFFAELRRRNVFRVAGVYAVVGWVLTQIATTLEDAMQLPSWFDGVIVAMLLVGFPIALVFAWAFELTPEGVVRTSAVPEGESITDVTGRRLDYAIIAGLVVLVALSALRFGEPPPSTAAEAVTSADAPGTLAEFAPRDETAISDASIAVLPFTDLSPDGDQEYFSDGIAEEILNVLVRTEGLDVTSRTSAFQFKGAGLGIPEIAKALRVRHVLEGSVRKSGATIRVTAQLIDANNDKHLWSDTFDRPLTAENIFAIQDEIAEAIVAALNQELGISRLEHVDVAPTTENLDAYELYLKARPLFLARLDLDVVDDLLARAIEQDPQFARAWEMRAAVQPLAVEYGYVDRSVEESERLAEAYAARALEIDPRSALAIAVPAYNASNAALYLRGKVDLAEVFAELDRALEIDPHNANIMNWRGLRYLHVGYLDKAFEDFGRCMEMEPLSVPCASNYVGTLAATGRDDEAMRFLYRSLDNGTFLQDNGLLALFARTGNELAFKVTSNSKVLLAGWSRHDELWAAYQDPRADHGELIESIRAYFASRERDTFGLDAFIWIAGPLGNDWERPEVTTMWDASMQHYRKTLAFRNFMRNSGAYDYWRKLGFPPQCRPVGADDFECD